MKKMLSVICLAVCLVAMLFTPACAQEDMQVVSAAWTAENGLELLLHAPVTEAIPAQQVTIALGKDNLPVTLSQTYAQSERGTSWIFVVDKLQGGSSGRLKELLTSLTGLVGPHDNAAIIPAGAEQKDIALISNTEALKNQISTDLLTRDTKIRTFYHTVNEAVTYLESTQDVKGRGVVVLVSPGTNDHTEQTTLVQALAHISESKIAVYTCALMHANVKESQIKDFHGLSNTLTISSPSGEASAKMAGYVEEIRANEQQLHVIQCSTAALTPELGDSLMVSVNLDTLKTAGYVLPEDVVSQLRAAAVTPTPEPTATLEPTATPEPTAAPTAVIVEEPSFLESDYGKLVILGAAIALAAVVILVLLLRRGKAIKGKETNVEDLKPEEGPDEHLETIIADELPVRVTLTPVNGPAGLHYDQDMTAEMTIGRDPGEQGLVIPEEEQYRLISRVHLRLFRNNDVVFAENLSRNGTTINGARMGTEPAVLHENDRITMGRVDFLISWHKIG